MQITQKNYKTLKKLYEKAVANGDEQFVWEGQDVLTAYAKYLLQYIESRRENKS